MRHYIPVILFIDLVCTYNGAKAQSYSTKFSDLPPGKPQYDENQVDVMAGGFSISEKDVAIGPENGGLSYVRTFFNVLDSHSFSLNGVTRSNFDADINTTDALADDNTRIVTASFGSVSDKFKDVPYDGSGTQYAISGNGATLSGSVYTQRDGTKIYYSNTIGSIYSSVSEDGRHYMATNYVAEKIEFPDGEIWIPTYKYFTLQTRSSIIRFQSINSNKGYQLKFFYSVNSISNNSSSDTFSQWQRPYKIVGLNSTVDYCNPSADTCAFSKQWPEVNYSHETTSSSHSITVTQPLARVTRYVSNGNLAIKFPLSSIDNIVYYQKYQPSPVYPSVGGYLMIDRVVRDSKEWKHTFATQYDNNDNYIGTHTVTDPDLGIWIYNFSWGKSSVPIATGDEYAESFYRTPNILHSVKDPINRLTSFTYDEFFRLKTTTSSEGNSWENFYDARGNVLKIVKKSKPGSGLADIVVQQQSFPASCVNRTSCNKPISSTDADGNVTAYSYDLIHGGVLTETGPAVNGVAPQKRYQYAQRYAWVKGVSGSYVAAPTPVWVLISEKYCKSASTVNGNCAGGSADEVITEYDYGLGSVPNNLLLRGVTVTSGNQNLHICYSYDIFGNRISETSPAANISACA